ncbi:MAG: sensor histidine kinase [Acidobacteria bacterium]|nr:sensor histidine kinase [Acidobacteriota bacterium]
MTSQNTASNRWEAIDTSWIFRLYALIAIMAGAALIGWGGVWFGADLEGLKWGKAMLLRVFGAQIVLAGCCAAAFSAVESPDTRRLALLWFGIGHAVVALIVALQTAVTGPKLTSEIAFLLFGIAFALLYLWGTADGAPQSVILLSLFGPSPQRSTDHLRNQYEHQIREAARQEERNRLARDLHDSVKQQIYAIQTAAATAEVRIENDAEGARQALSSIRNAAREASTEMQAMLDQLRAAPLENAGLISAIRQQCEATGFRTGASVQCSFGELPPSREFPPGAQEALLRVTQEALANTARHARAKNVSLSLTSGAGFVQLQVRDDGAGFDTLAPNQRGGQGLSNIRARAEEFGGAFDIESSPGMGTRVSFSIPYAPAEPASTYARRAILYAAALVTLIAVMYFRRASPGLTALTVMFLIGTARNAVAWNRVR